MLSILLFVLIPFTYLQAGTLDIDLTAWTALDSEYGEYPGPTAPEPDYIWGNFPTTYFSLDTQITVWNRFILRLSGTYGIMHPSTMYLDSYTNSLPISGSLWGFHPDIVYRLLDEKDSYLDIYIGFSYTSAVKHLGSIGEYSIVLFGAQAGIKGEASLSDHLGIFGEIYGFPLFENSSTVSGVAPQLIEESAKGYRYGFDTALCWTFFWFQLKTGLRYQRIYYKSGEFATHDLGIRYAGPYISLGFHLD